MLRRRTFGRPQQSSIVPLVWFLFIGTPCWALQSSGDPLPSGPEERQLNPPRRPSYRLDRSEEDWSFLRDASFRADPWDPIKYIPLGRNDWYLSLGGEVRPFYEFYRNYNWGLGPQDDNGYFLHRFIGHADLNFGKRVRIFSELKSGLGAGRNGGLRPVQDQDKLDLSQFFLELYSHFRKGSPALTVRIGRQELNYGEGSLVAIRELNVRREFDGVKLILRPPGWRIDAFAVKPAQTKPGVFDDAPDPAQTLWGVYAATTKKIPSFLKELDLYYFGLDRKRARFDQGVARDQRHTLGASMRGQKEAFSYWFEGDMQFGKFGAGQLFAWKYAQNLSYELARTRFRPLLSLLGAISSGDKDPRNPDLQTFHPLFPKGLYYGYIDSSGSLNAIVVHPKVGLQLSKTVTFAADSFFFWRQRVTDGLYSQPGVFLRTGQASGARYVGALQHLEVLWHVDRHTTIQFLAAYYEVGGYLRETPPAGRNTTYFSLKMNYKF